jgi:hypothetical protein
MSQIKELQGSLDKSGLIIMLNSSLQPKYFLLCLFFYLTHSVARKYKVVIMPKHN